MDVIQLLPDSVANQIAAGEVIQRPASVVKELVENAIDAQAHRIDVVAVDAGRTSLQVVDDGKGMSETDARLAFERHATSKIRQASDLFSLTTMGFRGEALPSIAAVSQVELTTRTESDDLGTHLCIEGSRVISQQATSCAVGSNFVVKNLFFNTPARRKFLKSNQTELTNIMNELERIVLVHPDVAFTFVHGSSTILNLAPTTLKQRIAGVFGERLTAQLLPVEVDTPIVRIYGFVGTPESSRKRGAAQFFFVNDRYMRHSYFHRAVQEAFTQLIPVDQQVPYFIYFDVPPAEIDVNIHPTKTEIKFENEQAIWQILLAAVRESLGRYNALPTIDFDTEGRPADMPVFNTKPTAAPSVRVNSSFNPFDAGVHVASTTPPPDEPLLPPSSGNDDAFDSQTRGSEHFQYRGSYILTAVQSGLMIIDQHRAHIRILHDRYLARLQQSAAPLPSQRLLFPEVVQLPASEAAVLQDILPQLTQLGFDLSSLGGTSLAIAAIPSGLEGVDPKQLVLDLIAGTSERGALPADQIRGHLALTLARAAAIPVGQVLSLIEMQDLVDQLFATSMPSLTPDGHKILTILPQTQIEKLLD